MSILPPREYATDDENRLAAFLNEAGEKLLGTVDAACKLRTAPGETKRQRAMVRTHLENAANSAMSALAYALDDKGA